MRATLLVIAFGQVFRLDGSRDHVLLGRPRAEIDETAALTAKRIVGHAHFHGLFTDRALHALARMRKVSGCVTGAKGASSTSSPIRSYSCASVMRMRRNWPGAAVPSPKSLM